ncbi:glutamine--fructose-6-phosphate transaminase domain protein [Nocardiopsis alba ATCC BAA-2165]|uniref:Glutamine--fructose-6-phosphate transaminase domain protein n=1 Tax=Nocardiopsis alba (strain ATCC BAA-2165 / BE74) TaxID=1205910 RepID=J7LD64_NOCAA|nr:glutamine--fructose-6-phosphate transaminase domain protein [Nocardiopsis alba ATCC BAA-2165]
MPDAGALAGHGVLFQGLPKVGELARPLLGAQGTVAQDGHTRGVISAVLQPCQAVHDDLERRLRPDVANDSAHGRQRKRKGWANRPTSVSYHCLFSQVTV